LLDPQHSPVSEGRWEYGSLVWPGIEGEVTSERAMHLWPEWVYVKGTSFSFTRNIQIYILSIQRVAVSATVDEFREI
jgi:hypothetical protein